MDTQCGPAPEQKKKGYRFVAAPGHPGANNWGHIREHIVVAEMMLGRPLEVGEVVHHINGDRRDNRPENLEVVPDRETHSYFHRRRGEYRRMPFDENELIECACGCGQWRERFDACGRMRRQLLGHGCAKKPRDEVVICACGCGRERKRFDQQGKERRYIRGHYGTDGHRAVKGK